MEMIMICTKHLPPCQQIQRCGGFCTVWNRIPRLLVAFPQEVAGMGSNSFDFGVLLRLTPFCWPSSLDRLFALPRLFLLFFGVLRPNELGLQPKLIVAGLSDPFLALLSIDAPTPAIFSDQLLKLVQVVVKTLFASWLCVDWGLPAARARASFLPAPLEALFAKGMAALAR